MSDISLGFYKIPPSDKIPEGIPITTDIINSLNHENEAILSIGKDSDRLKDIYEEFILDIIAGTPPTLAGKDIGNIERFPAYNPTNEAHLLVHKLHPGDLLRLPDVHYERLFRSFNVNNDGYCTAANNSIENKNWSFFSPFYDIDSHFGATGQVFNYNNALYSKGSWVFVPPPIKSIQESCYDNAVKILNETEDRIVIYFLVIGNEDLTTRINNDKYFCYKTEHAPNMWILHRYNGQPVNMQEKGTFFSLRKDNTPPNMSGWFDYKPTNLHDYSPKQECS